MVLVTFLVWLMVKIVDSGSRVNTVTDGVSSLAQPTTIDGGRMPRFTNGTEYGIGMWIYVNEPPRSSMPSPILSFGNNAIFRFEPGRSDVGITFPTYMRRAPVEGAGGALPAEGAGAGGAALPVTEAEDPAINTIHAKFDHVSLKRWVHLMAVHVDGTITLFKDGELYSVSKVQDGDVSAPSGSIRLGGRSADAYVSSVVFFNHFPSDKQVKSAYRSGPYTTNRLFRMMGFDNIGLRSPIYQVTE